MYGFELIPHNKLMVTVGRPSGDVSHLRLPEDCLAITIRCRWMDCIIPKEARNIMIDVFKEYLTSLSLNGDFKYHTGIFDIVRGGTGFVTFDNLDDAVALRLTMSDGEQAVDIV